MSERMSDERERDEARAALAKAREALAKLKDALECGPPENNRTHYCPNCDNSLFDAYQIVVAALDEQNMRKQEAGAT